MCDDGAAGGERGGGLAGQHGGGEVPRGYDPGDADRLAPYNHLRIGQMAGDPNSLWTRRMTIDIHDVEEDLLDAACNQGRSGGKDRDAALSHRPGTPFLRVAGVQNRVPRDRD